MKADVKVHLSGVWMEGARGCPNAGVAHVGISCMSGDCSRQHGKTQNRSASQMFGGRSGDLCLPPTHGSRPLNIPAILHHTFSLNLPFKSGNNSDYLHFNEESFSAEDFVMKV